MEDCARRIVGDEAPVRPRQIDLFGGNVRTDPEAAVVEQGVMSVQRHAEGDRCLRVSDSSPFSTRDSPSTKSNLRVLWRVTCLQVAAGAPSVVTVSAKTLTASALKSTVDPNLLRLRAVTASTIVLPSPKRGTSESGAPTEPRKSRSCRFGGLRGSRTISGPSRFRNTSRLELLSNSMTPKLFTPAKKVVEVGPGAAARLPDALAKSSLRVTIREHRPTPGRRRPGPAQRPSARKQKVLAAVFPPSDPVRPTAHCQFQVWSMRG